MKKLYFVIIILWIPLCLEAQKTDKKLLKKVNELVTGFQGEVGVYIKNIRTGKIVAINADSIFPTASMVKIPILIGVMDKIEKGALQYHQDLIYKDSLLYAGEDILGSFKDGEKIKLSKVLLLMLSTSDNTASLWLQSLAGSGTRINELLNNLGFNITRVNSRTTGREASRNFYGWGQTTPREMSTLLENIYEGKILSQKASERMLRLLGRNYWDEVGVSQVPPTVFVASKNGAVDDSRSETILVMAPHHPYVFSVQTKNLGDKSWNPGNEAWVLTRKISALLWNYFEPRSRWHP